MAAPLGGVSGCANGIPDLSVAEEIRGGVAAAQAANDIRQTDSGRSGGLRHSPSARQIQSPRCQA